VRDVPIRLAVRNPLSACDRILVCVPQFALKIVLNRVRLIRKGSAVLHIYSLTGQPIVDTYNRSESGPYLLRISDLTWYEILELAFLFPLLLGLIEILWPWSSAMRIVIKILLLTFYVFEIHRVIITAISRKFQNLECLTRLVNSHLASNSRYKQAIAIRVLGVLVGQRFGNGHLGRGFATRLQTWRAWWQLNKDNLKLYKPLDVFVLSNELPFSVPNEALLRETPFDP
jgi:hypothetical protein